jgi:hypothetical protein
MCLTFLYIRYKSEVLFSIYQIFYLSTRVLILFPMSLRARGEAVSILELEIASGCALAMTCQEGE